VTDTSLEAANDQLISEFIRAWERRDTEHIVNGFADDGVYHSIPLEPIIGKDAIRTFVAGFEGVPAGRLEVHHQVASGNVVMNERTDFITLNGKAVTLPICGVFELENGRIKAWREYFDLAPARAAFQSE
jgi:limonene-1,2-epoxide hydrolase